MPTLHWIGKDKVINHHRDVAFKVLEHQYGFTAGKGKSRNPTGSGNIVIHGDNLEALKSLLPQYEGKVKCIYIDPPYNTGNEGWVYNDNVNDPRFLRWLQEREVKVEDLNRHDKWLCMMYPRLVLLHKLLADDGVIFISIDDVEVYNLKLILDEIFGRDRFLASFSWVRKKKGSFLSTEIRKMTEYVLCLKKTRELITLYGDNAYSEKAQPIVKRTNKAKELFFKSGLIETTLPDGVYERGQRGNEETGLEFLNDFTVINGRVQNDVRVRARFTWSQEYLDNEIALGSRMTLSKKFGFNVYRHDQADKIKAPSTLINSEQGVGTNEDASGEIATIFSAEVGKVFNYPKPVSLIEYLLRMQTRDDKDAIILDSFAGSGTTAHAVLNLNKQDGGNRKFILIEMMDYAETITAERVKRVMEGYGEGKNAVEGTGGAFDYYNLGQPLFDESQNLNEDVGVERIHEYIWYTETRSALPNDGVPKGSYYLGTHEGMALYFVYERDALTTLDHDLLATLTVKGDPTVIYADNCLLPKKFLEQHGIVFKKIPRDISRF
jgi:adenine-specific DNA-methyltransferase